MSDAQATRNEDWIKTLAWDLPGVETLAELEAISGMTAAELRKLPAIEAAPPAIREALGLPASIPGRVVTDVPE